jgi:hypothetical protein
MLVALHVDRSRWVREAVAEHPATPVANLRILAKDPEGDVRAGVARNRATPIVGLTYFAKDEDWFVRKHVADRPDCPLEILKSLASDSDENVRTIAGIRLKARCAPAVEETGSLFADTAG